MERNRFGGGGGGYGYENGVIMTRDPKPRLRWTADLHDRFVDAVTKLGGPDSESLFLLVNFFFFNAVYCIVIKLHSLLLLSSSVYF